MDIDGPTQAEIQKDAALHLCVLTLDLVAGGYEHSREAAGLVLRELRERYGVTPQDP